MIRINNQNLDLEMPIGDTGVIPISVTNKKNNQSILTDGDEIKFSLKKGVSDNSFLIQKTAIVENGKATISFKPSDTLSLDPGNYVYSLKLYRKSGSVDTLNGVNPFSNFVLKQGVKRD